MQATGAHRPEDITVQTYHAFAANLVREHGLLVGVEAESGLLSDAQQWQLVLSCIDSLPAFEAIELRSPAGIVRAALELAGSISDHAVSTADVVAADDRIVSSMDAPEPMRENSQKRRELCRLVDAYVDAKRRTHRIDYGDQVMRAVDVLEGFADVRAALQARYLVLLLDEYQDTNVAQRRMVEALVGDRGAVTAVGDARQAIYGWRGATMYNLIGFPGHFPRAGGHDSYEPIPLSENFRSGAKILDVANEVVSLIPQERRPGTELRAFPDNGDGSVQLGLFADEGAEATFIADRIEALHGEPTAPGRNPVSWRDIAILVRRKSTMDSLYEELSKRDVPVEVVGLNGLLHTPEVLEVLAWLRCLQGRPSANRWMARILLGPRWRIHYRDLALCARWAAEQEQGVRLRLAGGDEDRARELAPGELGVSLVEVLDHVDEIDGLGAEARNRLSAFHRRLEELRQTTTGPLLETVQRVIDRCGVAEALDAAHTRSAPAARQNLSNFLDHVAAFAPIEGEAGLRSFLAYLDAADDAEETLEAVQSADQDSVKLMTIHSAKGLEFECVFIPSVAASENAKGSKIYSIFPDTRGPNPLTSYRTLPYEVREDREHLPSWKGKLKVFTEQVKERAAEDERRLFYVALTRAKQRLFVTAAWWYGRADRAKGPSEFFEELETLQEKGMLESIERAGMPPENPMLERLRGTVEWPPAPATAIDDDLFEGGHGVAADALLSGAIDIEDLTRSLSETDRNDFDRLLAVRRREIEAIANADRSTGAPVTATIPDVLSATAWVRLEKGETTAWDLARPLPERPTKSRRIGTEVHRLIEERSRGISAFPDETELDTPAEQEDAGRIREMLEAWEEAYGDRPIATLPSGEPMIELPFTLKKDGRVIRGRIDAVYENDDGTLEIVDFKTGGSFTPDERADQLDLYREALRSLDASARVAKVTYLFLALAGPQPSGRESYSQEGEHA
jgi:DNA helicase-2/ATP-dependent DNA helicase PcrA